MNKIEKYIQDMIDKSTPDNLLWNVEKIKFNKPTSWNYIDGCMMSSILELYKITKEKKYLDFIENYLNFFIEENGNIKTYDINKFTLDDICESKILFDMYDITKKEKYQKAIKYTYNQIEKQPRTEEGSFWHKLIYPNQVWLDGFYMVMPFYVRYINKYLNNDYLDIIKMYEIAHKKMFNRGKQLYYHGYDCSKQIFWADKQTGLSKSFWLRSMGWFMSSIVEIYEDIKDDVLQEYFKVLLKEAIDGVLQYQDKETMMFYQVVDQGNKEGNYVETSGTLMIAYTILKAVRLNILNQSYYVIGNEIFNGVCKKYLSDEDDFSLGGICLVAGLGPENNLRRNGTYEYYISEPVVKNEAKGIASFIMTYIERMRSNYENRN